MNNDFSITKIETVKKDTSKKDTEKKVTSIQTKTQDIDKLK